MSELRCQRCGQDSGRVHCYLDAAKTVAHATLTECMVALRARVAELEALVDDIQDELSEGRDT